MKKKIFIYLLGALVLFFALYWIKCALYINLSDDFSLSEHLPIKFMVPKNPQVVKNPRRGVVLRYDFEGGGFWKSLNPLSPPYKGGSDGDSPSKGEGDGDFAYKGGSDGEPSSKGGSGDGGRIFEWNGIWSREKGMVRTQYHPGGVENSRCVYIQSDSEKEWSFRPRKVVAVEVGQEYVYQGSIKSGSGGLGKICMSMVLYDKNLKVMNWNYQGTCASSDDKEWQRVGQAFEIPENVFAVQVGVLGSGVGGFYVDDVVLIRKR